jgi:hypothetical protein
VVVTEEATQLETQDLLILEEAVVALAIKGLAYFLLVVQVGLA